MCAHSFAKMSKNVCTTFLSPCPYNIATHMIGRKISKYGLFKLLEKRSKLGYEKTKMMHLPPKTSL
ncbi:hypothetical protein BC6307_07165 [Sutcliffiella cohnii]|uniref:Uncharacterized protein n=1 Tax=Sutcliffiella cohnii TaxID=33932 RepID=A0A223KNL2_9BACI|nr:hypothetical protein BC6307_07165 [Sutcliffiella cohnii]